MLRVDSYYANASSLETDGVDLSVSRELDLRGGGSLRVGADTTYIMNYDLQDPQAGAIEGAGRRNFANFGTSTPEWKGNLFVTWQTERHAVNAFVRYIDSYVDDEVDIGQGSAFFRPIDSQVTLDAQYSPDAVGAARAEALVRRHQRHRRRPAARADEAAATTRRFTTRAAAWCTRKRCSASRRD